jgi:hypothetical protein
VFSGGQRRRFPGCPEDNERRGPLLDLEVTEFLECGAVDIFVIIERRG